MTDGRIWNARHNFTLREAAYLWYDCAPETDLRTIDQERAGNIKDVYSLLFYWRREVAGPDFPDVQQILLNWEMTHLIPRDVLATFAKGRGFAPKFLFNDGDKWSLSTPEKSSNDQQHDLMAGAREEALSNDEHHTGLAGRPNSKHLYETEHERRLEAGEAYRSVGKEAVHLSAWLTEKHPKSPRIRPGALENSIRSVHREKYRPQPGK